MSEKKLPTENEIAALPRWARIAFAARCARRAQSHLLREWPTAPEEHLAAIDRAICIAETAAAEAAAATARAEHAARAAYAAAAAARATDAVRAADAARAAADAAHAARLAYAAVGAAYGGYAAYAATTAAAADAAGDAAISSICQDYRVLSERSRREGWTDSTPVPPSVFGPLVAPVMPPASTPRGPRALELKCYLSPSADSDMVGDKLVELYDALNDYSIVKYGRGLTIDEFEQFVNTGALQPTGEGGPS